MPAVVLISLRYKQEYEQFKMTVTLVILGVISLSYFMPSRFLDSVSNFLMVWYYCTLTIRESILRVNGSKIKVALSRNKPIDLLGLVGCTSLRLMPSLRNYT